jgi:hypothetical protein
MSDDPQLDLEEMARSLDESMGHVPLSKPTIVLPPPVRPFPARALRYGPGQAPILERDP